MNTKHTPGPWSITEPRYMTEAIEISTSGEMAFACVWGSDEEDKVEIAHANAHLIAAAPEMLAVLTELQESAAYWSEYDVPLGITDRINEVIAKATGAAHECP